MYDAVLPYKAARPSNCVISFVALTERGPQGEEVNGFVRFCLPRNAQNYFLGTQNVFNYQVITVFERILTGLRRKRDLSSSWNDPRIPVLGRISPLAKDKEVTSVETTRIFKCIMLIW
jgi:hypothetical protein